MDPEKLGEELPRLNRNLEALNENLRRMLASQADLSRKLDAARPIAEELSVIRQLLMQTGRLSGTAGVIAQVLATADRLARRGRRT